MRRGRENQYMPKCFQVRRCDLDLIRELPYGPATYDGRNQGRTDVSELCGILGDEAIRRRGFSGTWMTSMPFSNLTPAMTFGN